MQVQHGYVHTDKNHLVFISPCQNVSLGQMVETTIRYQLKKTFRPCRAIRQLLDIFLGGRGDVDGLEIHCDQIEGSNNLIQQLRLYGYIY